MPPIGLLIARVRHRFQRAETDHALISAFEGGRDFSRLGDCALKHGTSQPPPEVAINYGKFINAAIKFAIVAWVLFLVIKGMNAMKRKEEAKRRRPFSRNAADVKLLTEIRDLAEEATARRRTHAFARMADAKDLRHHRRREALDAAIDGGARFVGFVTYPEKPALSSDAWTSSPPSPVAPAAGRAETRAGDRRCADDEHLAAGGRCTRAPTGSSSTAARPPGRVAEARQFCPAGRDQGHRGRAPGLADLMAAEAYEPVADMLLFDAKAPAGRPAGWQRGWLSTGANPGGQLEVQPALAAGGGADPQQTSGRRSASSGADLVDVSSGVEAAPGVKDPALIAPISGGCGSLSLAPVSP